MDIVVLVCLILIAIIQLITFLTKKNYKRGLKSDFATIADTKYSDQYLEYYKKMQLVDIYRLVSTIILAMVIVRRADSSIFQVFAIALGAIILVFQTLILSFVIYLMLVSNYKVGETVKIGALGEGEIIYIKPLYFGLAGRNKGGEHTGEFFLIPNNKVRENPIVKVDYSIHANQKNICSVFYDPAKHSVSLHEFILQYVSFLDGLLPVRNAKDVGHYKSYIGYKYKMDYEFQSTQIIEIRIGFVCKQSKANDLKRQIFEFIQSIDIAHHNIPFPVA